MRCVWVIPMVVCLGCDGMSSSSVTFTELEKCESRAVVALASARRLSRGWQSKSPAVPFETEQRIEDVAARVKPCVMVYGMPGFCPACQRFLSWWDGLGVAEREKLPIRFAYRDQELPEFAERAGRPAFHWEGTNRFDPEQEH